MSSHRRPTSSAKMLLGKLNKEVTFMAQVYQTPAYLGPCNCR